MSDALEALAQVYGAAFLPALPLLFPPITALASPTSSGKAAFQHTHSRNLLQFQPPPHLLFTTLTSSSASLAADAVGIIASIVSTIGPGTALHP